MCEEKKTITITTLFIYDLFYLVNRDKRIAFPIFPLYIITSIKEKERLYFSFYKILIWFQIYESIFIFLLQNISDVDWF